MIPFSRESLWERVTHTPQWDVIVVGGGITGAGILREAARAGLRVLLLEQRDFAWGTSSRSSKMVHGGLRYLKQGQIGVTYQSVRERQNLLNAGEGLIEPLGFLMPIHSKGSTKLIYKLGLSAYDLMALRWEHRQYSNEEIALLAPRLSDARLHGGFYFEDAQTDDARLVLRVIQEAVVEGGMALNYARVTHLLKDEGGAVNGVSIADAESAQVYTAHARVVINATGAWVDGLRADVGGESRIRPLRGSHLIFPSWRFPLAQAVSFPHPHDGRPVFVYPWEDVTLVGTTDLDHHTDLNTEPCISGDEVAYLLAACRAEFPALDLSVGDIVSTYAGVRPVIGTGKSDPSKESRDHVVWVEDGLLSVTGGKLTTFRVIALDALETALPYLPQGTRFTTDAPALNPVAKALPTGADALTAQQRTRLSGRYGACFAEMLRDAPRDSLTVIPNTRTLWAELWWAARREAVVHLDDLLLRRTRIGLTLPRGGLMHIERIRQLCAPELAWDDTRWQDEIERYTHLWQTCYSLPARETIPPMESYLPQETAQAEPTSPRARGVFGVLLLLVLVVGVVGLWWRRAHSQVTV